MYFRRKTSAGRAYLQIVASRRVGAQVRQQVIATLGRYDDLRESGQLERLLRSGARFSTKAMVVDAVAEGSATVSEVRRLGPALVFERLWEETGCRAVIEELASERKHEFALERAVFLTVLHRLFAGGSDRAADRWRDDYRIDPFVGDVFVFRGRAGSLIKALWHDGIGLSLYAKRLDRGRFVWPTTVDGVVALTAAQMSYLLEAIDWRNPQHTWRPQSAG